MFIREKKHYKGCNLLSRGRGIYLKDTKRLSYTCWNILGVENGCVPVCGIPILPPLPFPGPLSPQRLILHFSTTSFKKGGGGGRKSPPPNLFNAKPLDRNFGAKCDQQPFPFHLCSKILFFSPRNFFNILDLWQKRAKNGFSKLSKAQTAQYSPLFPSHPPLETPLFSPPWGSVSSSWFRPKGGSFSGKRLRRE